MKKTLGFAVLAVCLRLLAAHPADAQVAATTHSQPVADIAITYSGVHANVPPGNCGCFWMRGGSAELAVPAWRKFSAVVELSGERVQRLPGLPAIGLSLVSFTAGPRYTYTFHRRYNPFAQALFGSIHGFDSYFPGSGGGSGAATSFAMTAGLGLDVSLRKHLLLRPIQAEYQYMQLPNNAVNQGNQQHDMRFSAGLVFRLTH